MTKKADINWQIISLILALMVFLILLFVFRNSIFKATNTSSTITSCSNLGKEGQCIPKDAPCSGYKLEVGCKANEVCCIPKT